MIQCVPCVSTNYAHYQIILVNNETGDEEE